MRRLLLALAAGALALGGACRDDEPAPEARPNVVVILADDLGYGDVGAYGSTRIQTPEIDRLAEGGVLLTDGYVASAVCGPSRAGLMTGRHPARFGYEYNTSGRALGLPSGERTLGDLMREAGYRTGLVGKWHLGRAPEHHPLRRGFDEFFGILGGQTLYVDPAAPGVETWRPERLPAERGGGSTIYRGREPTEVSDYLTDVFAERAVDFIDRHAGEPFFLLLAPTAPHTPLQAIAADLEPYRAIESEPQRIYSAMVASLDDLVGAVTGALRARGLEEDTLVVFLSDNGCARYLPDACTNRPLAGGKRLHLEGGVRVPFLFRWPGVLPEGAVFSQPASALDLFATLASIAGTTGATEDSVDLLPHLRGEVAASPHERLFWRAAPNRAVRSGRYKLWQVDRSELTFDALRGSTLPRGTGAAGSPLGQKTVLYDLESDAGEAVDLSERHPEIAERLVTELEQWESEVARPAWPSVRSTLHELHGTMVRIFF